MREWPLRAWVLVGALVAFSVVVLSVLYWAQFTGRAGTQRGLVIHNDRDVDLTVSIEGVQTHAIAAGEEETFVIKRDQFPTQITVTETKASSSSVSATTLLHQIDYRDVADAEFRLSIDEQGIHPTATYRDTPVPAMKTP